MGKRNFTFAIALVCAVMIFTVVSGYAAEYSVMPVVPNFTVNGEAWDLDEMEVIIVGNVLMAPVDVLLTLGIYERREPIIPSIRLFERGDYTLDIREGHVSFWVWQPTPDRPGGRTGFAHIQLAVPTLLNEGIMYIPISAIADIATIMNDQVEIELNLPAIPQSLSSVELEREQYADYLWARYQVYSVQDLFIMGYSRQDIVYVFGRIQNNRATAQNEEQRLVERAEQERLFRHSSITLPNRRLTASERTDWIAEYNQLGGASAFELEIVRLINEIRSEHRLSNLQIDDTLMMAGRFYAQTMATFAVSDNWSHNVGPYAVRGERHGASANVVRAFGGQLRWNGGNASRGSGLRSAESVVEGWMNSDGHRRYILSPEHRFIGVGSSLNHSSELGGHFIYLFLSNSG